MPLPVAIRLNPFKGSDGPEGTPVPWNPLGRILSERPSFTLDPLLHAGCYYVQDSSAMFPGYLFRKALALVGKPGIRVLDLCAAPGGKTTDLAASLRSLYGDDFLLVSNEVMQQRARTLSSNVALWGDPCVMVTSVDPGAFARFGSFFDVILADVPCSGEGMFRKDKTAVQQFSEDTVALCAARQKRILRDAWPSLRQGGVLVYSTCTYREAENDSNLLWTASELGGEIVPPRDEFSSYGVCLTRCGSLLQSGVVPGEGQWAGMLVKTSSAPLGRFATKDLARTLHPLRYGVVKGEKKGSELVPDADYALSLKYEGEYPEIALSLRQALHYLHHDPLVFPDAPLGFNLVSYQGHPLGFVKNLGRRCNSLHPISRRILMDLPPDV